MKQYVDAQGEHQTVVPRVIGNTDTAQQSKRPRARAARVDRKSLLAAIREINSDASVAAEALFDWAEHNSRLTIRWTRAGDIALPDRPTLLRVYPSAALEVCLRGLVDTDPSWDADRIEDLAQRLNSIDGVRLATRKWPRTPLAALADPVSRERFRAVFEEVIVSLPDGP